MEISKEQLKEIKIQLINQIISNFPEEKKEETISKIKGMNDEQLIEFLKQNNLIKTEGNSENPKCIFCSIVFGDVPSTKIGENSKAIAILELNPISEGHSLVIPKNHIEKESKIDEESKQLAKETSQKIAKAFQPKKIDIFPENLMGHSILNIIPIYDNENLQSSRTKKTPDQLKKIQEKILEESNKKDQKKETTKKLKQIDSREIILPKRIP